MSRPSHKVLWRFARDSLKRTGAKPRVKGHLRRELWGPPEKAALSEGVYARYPNDRGED